MDRGGMERQLRTAAKETNVSPVFFFFSFCAAKLQCMLGNLTISVLELYD
jgi:hypothetical protein